MNSELGLVACYFNPCKYARRHQNYLDFYECLGAHKKDLITVELAFDDQVFDLEALDNRLALRTKTLVWQKEALLNVGIREAVNRGYKYICWLDADISFNEADWYNRILNALDTHNLVQVFEVLKRFDDEDTFQVMKSTAASIGNVSEATGFGWACPSSFFEDCMLYDKMIVGGGDTLIYAAGNGVLEEWLRKRVTTYRHSVGIVDWANRWYAKTQGRVGYAKNRIETFYHGTIQNRNYLNRYEILRASSFDPVRDITVDEVTGLLEWLDTSKVGLQDDIRDYFVSRQEDG
jgi:hypothetical protein